MRLFSLMAAMVAVLSAAVPAKAGNCQAGMSFQQLQCFQPLAVVPPDPVPLALNQLQYAPQQPLQIVQQPQYYQAPVAALQFRQFSQAGYGYQPQAQFQNFQTRQRTANFQTAAPQPPPVIIQNFTQAPRRQPPPPVIVQNFQQPRQQPRFAANTGGEVRIRPTGLARLFGVGGPDVQISNGGGVSVQPTGLARLFGTGGSRINTR